MRKIKLVNDTQRNLIKSSDHFPEDEKELYKPKICIYKLIWSSSSVEWREFCAIVVPEKDAWHISWANPLTAD